MNNPNPNSNSFLPTYNDFISPEDAYQFAAAMPSYPASAPNDAADPPSTRRPRERQSRQSHHRQRSLSYSRSRSRSRSASPPSRRHQRRAKDTPPEYADSEPPSPPEDVPSGDNYFGSGGGGGRRYGRPHYRPHPPPPAHPGAGPSHMPHPPFDPLGAHHMSPPPQPSIPNPPPPPGPEHGPHHPFDASSPHWQGRPRRGFGPRGRGGFGGFGMHGLGHDGMFGAHGPHGPRHADWDPFTPLFGALGQAAGSGPGLNMADMARAFAEQLGLGGALGEEEAQRHTQSQTPAQTQGQNRATGQDLEPDFHPPVDVFCTPSAWVVRVSLPGAKKEDCSLTWDERAGELRVQGVVARAAADEELMKYLVSEESAVGLFSRAVKLGGENGEKVEVDQDRIEAKMLEGVLVVKVPKNGAEEEFVEVKKVDIL